MRSYMFVNLHNIMLLLLFAVTVCSNVHYSYHIITPSVNAPCPQEPCITLSHFAAIHSVGTEKNTSLLFLMGNHSLDRKLSLTQRHTILMKSEYVNASVIVECTSHSGWFSMSNTIFVSIQGLHFIGCARNTVTKVDQLILEDTIFQGVDSKGMATVLVLNEVAAATITRNFFLTSTPDENLIVDDSYSNLVGFDYVIDYLFYQEWEFMDFETYLMPSEMDCGALYIGYSNVIILDTMFEDNKAKLFGAALTVVNGNISILNTGFESNRAGADSFEFRSRTSHGVILSIRSDVFIDNTTFVNNTADLGGAFAVHNSSVQIASSTFRDNSAIFHGGVLSVTDTLFTISNCSFFGNNVSHPWYDSMSGGVMFIRRSSFEIMNCIFINNSAPSGGVIDVLISTFNITKVTFTNNSARTIGKYGGVILDSKGSSFIISHSDFVNNTANDGGVIYSGEHSNSTLVVKFCIFVGNNAEGSGGVISSSGSESSLSIFSSIFNDNFVVGGYGGVIYSSFDQCKLDNSTFLGNRAFTGGVIYATYESTMNTITNCNFINNFANGDGAVIGTINTGKTSISIVNCSFSGNIARYGGVMKMFFDFSVIVSSMFTNNSAEEGAIFHIRFSSLSVTDSILSNCTAKDYGGAMLVQESTVSITNSSFLHNEGSLFIFSRSNLTFNGFNNFENCLEPTNMVNDRLAQEGGAITSYQSTVVFNDEITFIGNQARHGGGAILATESTVTVYGEMTIANNLAVVNDGRGGGIQLSHSDLQVKGSCYIHNNTAVSGGGIHASSSTLSIHQPGTLHLADNTAMETGGGMHLQANPRLNILKYHYTRVSDSFITLIDNHASFGGAIFVADTINTGACLSNVECFVQSLAFYESRSKTNNLNIFFAGNTALEYGADLYGGLLDRCTLSLFSEFYQNDGNKKLLPGTIYLQSMSNVELDFVTSHPVWVCFCNSSGKPDCMYQPPPKKVKRGEEFTVSLVAIDHVNHPVDADVISLLSSSESGFDEGQQTQRVGRNCTDLKFNVFSPNDAENITLFADGPCQSATHSVRTITVNFLNCSCPVGFEISNSRSSLTRCECVCHSALAPYISNCNSTTNSLKRINTNSWIKYINGTDPSGYVIHPYCPYDYCHPSTESIIINFNLHDGADAQCAYNRTGILCGACQKPFSLSLGSSRCMGCHKHWPVMLIIILSAAIVAGVALVAVLLIFKINVADGLINGFIFYANILAANDAVLFSDSPRPSFPRLFIAWLNLDIGVDVCFFKGLDAYAKTWIQLGFPLYVISLIIIIIVVSENVPKFARKVSGRNRDPVATLATLALLSYTKLLSTIIAVLSYAILHYPDGSKAVVWLQDGNLSYLEGKHIALVVVVFIILLIGIPYTVLLFFWQWLLHSPKCTTNIRLNAIITTYHAPYNYKHRYWTGLLLLVRVVLYISAAVSESSNPQFPLLMTVILVAGLLFLKGIFGIKVYKNSLVDIMETVILLNILCIAAFTLYEFKTNITRHVVAVHISTITVCLLLFGATIHHVIKLLEKWKRAAAIQQDEYRLEPINQQRTSGEITYSVVDISNLEESDSDEQNLIVADNVNVISDT